MKQRRHAFLSLVTAAMLGLAGSPRPITVGVVCGDGVDCAKAHAALKMATDRLFLDTGIRLVVSEEKPAPYKVCAGFFAPETGGWYEVAAKVLTQKPDLILALSENPSSCPLNWEDMFGILGMADGIGTVYIKPHLHMTPLVYARLATDDAVEFQAQILAHEIAHSLGAQHTDEGLMAPYASPEFKRLSLTSRLQILFTRLRF